MCSWNAGNLFQSADSHLTFNPLVFKYYRGFYWKQLFCLVLFVHRDQGSGCSRRQLLPLSQGRYMGICIVVSGAVEVTSPAR